MVDWSGRSCEHPRDVPAAHAFGDGHPDPRGPTDARGHGCDACESGSRSDHAQAHDLRGSLRMELCRVTALSADRSPAQRLAPFGALFIYTQFISPHIKMQYTKHMQPIRVIEHLLMDTATAVLRWPIWWYSAGFVAMLKWFVSNVQYYARLSAVGVWLRNIFTPMFGQYDWQSRLISFLVRVGNIIVRGFGLLLWTALCAFGVLGYLLWPPVLLYVLLMYGI